MDSYRYLAAWYDRFTGDVGYPLWADYAAARFREAGIEPGIVLDLACGTGRLCAELAKRGYETIGVDASADMLMRAMENTAGSEPRPLFCSRGWSGWTYMGRLGRACAAWTV